MSPACAPVKTAPPSPVIELTSVVMNLVDDLDAVSDRLLYAEAALHHICDRLGITPHELPDPMRRATA